MRLNPFGGQAEPLTPAAPMITDMAVVRTVVGFAPAPPALLEESGAVDGTAIDPAEVVPIVGGSPPQLAPVPLPIEIFDADELLG